jgi:hypothetical protein
MIEQAASTPATMLDASRLADTLKRPWPPTQCYADVKGEGCGANMVKHRHRSVFAANQAKILA